MSFGAETSSRAVNPRAAPPNHPSAHNPTRLPANRVPGPSRVVSTSASTMEIEHPIVQHYLKGLEVVYRRAQANAQQSPKFADPAWHARDTHPTRGALGVTWWECLQAGCARVEEVGVVMGMPNIDPGLAKLVFGVAALGFHNFPSRPLHWAFWSANNLDHVIDVVYDLAHETPCRILSEYRSVAGEKQWQKQAVKMYQGAYRPVELKNPEKTRRSKRGRDKEPQQGTRISPRLHGEEATTVAAGQPAQGRVSEGEVGAAEEEDCEMVVDVVNVEISPEEQAPPSKRPRTQKNVAKKAATKKRPAKRPAAAKGKKKAIVPAAGETELSPSVEHVATPTTPLEGTSSSVPITVPVGDFTFRAAVESSREPSSDATAHPGAQMSSTESTRVNTPARTPPVTKALQIEAVEEAMEMNGVALVPAPVTAPPAQVTRQSERLLRKRKAPA